MKSFFPIFFLKTVKISVSCLQGFSHNHSSFINPLQLFAIHVEMGQDYTPGSGK